MNWIKWALGGPLVVTMLAMMTEDQLDLRAYLRIVRAEPRLGRTSRIRSRPRLKNSGPMLMFG